MDPTKAFCDNPDCPSRGKVGCGNIKVHSHKEQRFRCATCGKTFAASIESGAVVVPPSMSADTDGTA